MITIRPLTTFHEIRPIEDLQRATWQTSDLEIIPAHEFHVLADNGACLLGAFDDTQLVGFVCGVLAVKDEKRPLPERLKMYSVAAGILPTHQKQGIGYQLKLAQRDFALNMGLTHITWTYDPLESVNGRFNIHKLGAVCHRYRRNYHGKMAGINAGLATDRFDVDWWLNSERVVQRIEKEKRPLILSQLLQEGIPILSLANDKTTHMVNGTDRLLIEIPANFQTIKQQNFLLALRWRDHSRQLFEAAFRAGYVTTNFVYDAKSVRSFYLLRCTIE